MVNFIKELLSFSTLLGDVLIVALLAYLVGYKFFNFKLKSLHKLLLKYGLLLAFLVALASTTGSLFYSEIAKYNPCKLCWYQRILMYPLVIILGIALEKKYHKEVIRYGTALSVIGAAIAGYQYYLQRFGGSNTPCSAVGYAESCSKIFLLDYGYITIPMMALTAFALILIFLYFAHLFHSLPINQSKKV